MQERNYEMKNKKLNRRRDQTRKPGSQSYNEGTRSSSRSSKIDSNSIIRLPSVQKFVSRHCKSVVNLIKVKSISGDSKVRPLTLNQSEDCSSTGSKSATKLCKTNSSLFLSDLNSRRQHSQHKHDSGRSRKGLDKLMTGRESECRMFNEEEDDVEAKSGAKIINHRKSSKKKRSNSLKKNSKISTVMPQGVRWTPTPPEEAPPPWKAPPPEGRYESSTTRGHSSSESSESSSQYRRNSSQLKDHRRASSRNSLLHSRENSPQSLKSLSPRSRESKENSSLLRRNSQLSQRYSSHTRIESRNSQVKNDLPKKNSSQFRIISTNSISSISTSRENNKIRWNEQRHSPQTNSLSTSKFISKQSKENARRPKKIFNFPQIRGRNSTTENAKECGCNHFDLEEVETLVEAVPLAQSYPRMYSGTTPRNSEDEESSNVQITEMEKKPYIVHTGQNYEGEVPAIDANVPPNVLEHEKDKDVSSLTESTEVNINGGNEGGAGEDPINVHYMTGIKNGTINDNDEQFNEKSRGKTGFFNAAVAYCLSIVERKTWSADFIDFILQIGEKLFLNHNEENREAKTPNYTDWFIYNDKKLIFEVEQREVLPNVSEGLKDFFKENKAGIFQTNFLAISIWKKRNRFYMFDSVGRNLEGVVDSEKGTAVLVISSSLQGIIDIILTKSELTKEKYYISKLSLLNILEEGINYVIINEQKAVLNASCYLGDSRNHQHLAMVVIALLYSKIENSSLWSQQTIDKVLNIGNQLHESCIIQNDPNLTIEDIPSVIEIEDTKLEMIVSPKILRINHNQPHLKSLYTGIQQYLQTGSHRCIVQFNNVSLGIWEQDKLFYLFEPYERNSEGYFVENGTACVQMHSTLISMMETIWRNSINVDGNIAWFLYGLKIIQVNDCDEKSASLDELKDTNPSSQKIKTSLKLWFKEDDKINKQSVINYVSAKEKQKNKAVIVDAMKTVQKYNKNISNLQNELNTCKDLDIPESNQELSQRTNYIPLADGSQIITGSFNLLTLLKHNLTYKHFSPVVSLTAVVISYKYSLTSWSYNVVDYVLHSAEIVQQKLRKPYNMSPIHEISKVSIGNSCYKVLIKFITSCTTSNLQHTLQTQVLNCCDRVMIVTNTYSCAVFLRNKSYYLFEGFSCNKVGLRIDSTDGCACIIRFQDVKSLVLRITYNKNNDDFKESLLISKVIVRKVNKYKVKPESSENLLKNTGNKYIDTNKTVVKDVTERTVKRYSVDITGYCSNNNGVHVINGSFCLNGRNDFQRRRIKPCHFVCMFCILNLMNHPIKTWDHKRIDFVLENGIDIFKHTDSITKASKRTIQNILLENYYFNIVLKLIVKPDVSRLYTLEQSLRMMLFKHHYLMIQFHCCCYALFKDEEHIHLFDPYAERDSFLYVTDNYDKVSSAVTTASWRLLNTVDDVARYIRKQVDPRYITTLEYYTYQVTSIKYVPHFFNKYNKNCCDFFNSEIDIMNKMAPIKLRKESFVMNEDRIWLKDNFITWKRTLTTMLRKAQHVKISTWKCYEVEISNDLYSLWGPIRLKIEPTNNNHVLAISVVAAITPDYLNVTEWNTTILDSIAAKGHELFRASNAANIAETIEINIYDIHSHITIIPYEYEVIYKLAAIGFLFTTNINELNLYRALRKCFEDYNVAILICGKKVLTVGKSNAFFLFDCQSAGPPIFADNYGACYVLQCQSFNRLVYSTVMTLRIQEYRTKFELYAVCIKDKNVIV